MKRVYPFHGILEKIYVILEFKCISALLIMSLKDKRIEKGGVRGFLK